MAKASSFSSACCGSSKVTVIRPGSRPTPAGRSIELLGHNLNRGLDQKLGPCEAILFELRQNLADVPAAAPFIVAVVALGEAVGTDTLGNAGSEDLLGAAAADAEEELYGGAVDERARQGLQLAEYVVDFAIPEGLCGHGGTSLCYCAPAQNATLANQ